ncbi:MAG: VOC family protein [Pseudomonadota bacterium]
MTAAADVKSTIHAAMRYRDAPAAIEWLCAALGFEKHAVHEDGEGGIAHAQLSFGNGLIMLSSVRDDAWGQRIAQPSEIGGRQTQACCLVVADPDAHYANAVAHGAEIIDSLLEQDYGGKGYSCRDPEGHLWWIGSYNPWA